MTRISRTVQLVFQPLNLTFMAHSDTFVLSTHIPYSEHFNLAMAGEGRIPSNNKWPPLNTPRTSSEDNARPRKRARYVTEACTRCKAQKVRCDGQLPCCHCSTRNPEQCHYQYASGRLPEHGLRTDLRGRQIDNGQSENDRIPPPNLTAVSLQSK